MKSLNRIIFSLGILATLCWTACKTEKVTTIPEPVKDITGTWKVTKASRNGTDLVALVDTSVVNFNNFKIVFQAGTYKLQNRLPFLVSTDGAYTLDDPQRPFVITFTPQGGAAVKTAFNYPIVNGVRVLTLSFSSGCVNNSYTYSFVKVN